MGSIKQVKKYLYFTFFLTIVSGCGSENQLLQKKFFRMDTITEISLVVKSKKTADSCWHLIDSLLTDWENRFSVEGPASEVRKINERNSNSVCIGNQLKEMIETAIRYGDTLDGRFDITVLPLKQLWGLGENSLSDLPIPDSEQVKSELQKIGYRRLHIRNDSLLFTSDQTRIDVGGIAKGFVLREITCLVEKYNINSYLVSAGGDLVIKGKRLDGRPWRIGIQHPRKGGIIGVIDIDSGSIVTSGDYERCRIVDGKRYHHIFDTRTGYSCSKNQSLTIYGPDPVEADIMSTGLFAKSASEIVEYVNSRPRFECMVIDSAGNIFISDRWKGKVEILEN